TFTVTSRSGAYGYSGCAQPVGLPSAITAVYSSLTRLTIPGIYVNQTYYPFAAPIDAISGGVVHEVDAAVAAEIDLALTAAGVPHGAVGTNTGLPAVFAQLTGLGPVAGGDRYPTITPIWTVDPPLDDYGAVMVTIYPEPAASNCQVDGGVVGVDQGFNLRLTSTDAYGRSVVSQALVFLDPFDVGALVPGATLAPSGTSVTVTAAPGAALDYESPYTVYDTFSLDTDRDGVAETTNATGSFSYDAGAAGLKTGRLSFDDQPWWWLGVDEVYSDYYFVAR
ncbi:MAG: hypothetical protein KC635_27110, partial [Myxococcales bacterium]|nr:hypothetical protein [Myxococcales bacterium]